MFIMGKKKLTTALQRKAYNSTCSKHSFTLAEVLVTLSIIGILAALTMPVMINSTRIAELRTGLKEGNAILSQAVKKMAVDEGGQLYKSYSGKVREFKPKFIKYFNVQTDHNFVDLVNSSNPLYKTYSKKQDINSGLLDEGQFTLSNKMTVFIQNSASTSVGIFVSIDVNGYKKPPNAWGHDLFTFELMDNDTLLPAGAPNTGDAGHSMWATGFDTEQSTFCSPVSSDEYNGAGCTAKALTLSEYWDDLPR